MTTLKFNSEKDFENYICKLMDETKECPLLGESISGYQQKFNIGNYGEIDIIRYHCDYEGYVFITIIELKKEIIDMKAVAQICRYIEGVKNFIADKTNNYIKNINIQAVLSAPNIKMNDDTIFLINAIECLSICTIDLSLEDGFKSNWISSENIINKPNYGEMCQLWEKIDKEVKISTEEYQLYLKKENSNNIININGDKHD